MRGFLGIAACAAALSACAPFEHGHYAEDVKYLNSAGDPAGTPLVFGIGESAPSTQYASGTKHWDHGGHYTPAYAPPAQSYTPVNYAAPQNYTLASQSAYQPATQSTYGTATTLGGIRFDAEGYAICDETYPAGHPSYRGHPHTAAY